MERKRRREAGAEGNRGVRGSKLLAERAFQCVWGKEVMAREGGSERVAVRVERGAWFFARERGTRHRRSPPPPLGGRRHADS